MMFSRRASGVGRISRFGSTVQIGATIALAIAAVLLVNWLAGRPGIRQRFDLTAADKNTLATATEGLLGRMEDEVLVEVLFRLEPGERARLDFEVMQRTQKLLGLMKAESGGKLDVQVIDLSDSDAWKERQMQLRIQGFENGLIVSNGPRRSFLRMSGDLAQFQEGREAQTGYVPPVIVAFTAEEALVEAILDVTRGESLRAYFTTGSGEPDLENTTDPFGAGLFADQLTNDGFEIATWPADEAGAVPEDCDVLVVLAPENAWSEQRYGAVLDYVEAGGRLVVAGAAEPDLLRKSDVPDLLDRFDLEMSEGRVMNFVMNPAGQPLDGLPQCELIGVGPQLLSTHPIVAPFRASNRAFVMPTTHRVRVRSQPAAGVAQHLMKSPPSCWLDLPPIDRAYQRGAESQDSIPLAAAVRRPPMTEANDAVSGLESIEEIRIVAFGSERAFHNEAMRSASILPAAFNWAADREHRIVVPPRDPDLRYLPRDDPQAYVRVARFTQWILPGCVAALGLLVWVVRTRGSRRRPTAPGTAVAS